MAAMSRTSRASCEPPVRINPGGKDQVGENFTKTTILTLQTTLMPSMSSADRVLICDVPFRNRSDSDIPE